MIIKDEKGMTPMYQLSKSASTPNTHIPAPIWTILRVNSRG